jgi:hypothetical protein
VLLSRGLGLLAIVAIEVGLAALAPALALEGEGKPGERRAPWLGSNLAMKETNASCRASAASASVWALFRAIAKR